MKSLKLSVEHGKYLTIAIVGNIIYLRKTSLQKKKRFFSQILIVNSMHSWNL